MKNKNPLLKNPTVARRTLDRIHQGQKFLGRIKRSPGAGMQTDLFVNGKPVVFVHNPRTGGRSLETFFNIKRLSHSYPVEKLSEKHWLANFVVTSVRHPLDRFYSGYFGSVKMPGRNRLVKMYGPGVKQLSPLEFLAIVQRHPRHGGLQTQWTDFPSATKPRADLVLKLEESANWEEMLRVAGINYGSRQIPHHGKSGNASMTRGEVLGLTEGEQVEIREAVEEYFATDYSEFCY